MATEQSLLEQLAEEVKKVLHLISGDPFDPRNTGLKGMLLKAVEELKDFDVTDFKANTEFRKRKESEMSRIMVSSILLVISIVVTSITTIILTKFFGG